MNCCAPVCTGCHTWHFVPVAPLVGIKHCYTPSQLPAYLSDNCGRPRINSPFAYVDYSLWLCSHLALDTSSLPCRLHTVSVTHLPNCHRTSPTMWKSQDKLSFCLPTPEGRLGCFWCLPLSGILGLSVWSLDCSISPLFFFCLVLSLFLSYPILLLAHSPDLFFPKPLFSER